MGDSTSPPAASAPIPLCLIGVGRMGRRHAVNIRANPRCELRYVVDPRADAAAAAAVEFNARAADVATALADPGLVGVVIASTTDTHAGLIEQACRAGKAILCEKPVDMEVRRVRQVLQVAEERGSTIVIGFNRRFDPSYAGVRQAADSGRLGRIEVVAITSRDWPVPSLEYLRTSGGMFRDMTIHDFDMARWLLQEEPVSVYAAAGSLVDPAIAAIPDVDTATIVLTTASGALCQISNSRRSVYGYDQRIEVFGSEGMACAGNQQASSVTILDRTGCHTDPVLPSFPERYAAAYVRELEHFLDCAEGRATPDVGVADGLRALVLAEAAEESLRANRPVNVPAG